MSWVTSRIAALFVLGMTAASCELFTQLDRSQIPSGFGGGSIGGAGGKGGSGGSGGSGGVGGGGCTSASQCPGEDTECQKRTCEEGVCGTAFTPTGTPVTTQTPSDCKIVVCDGAGAETTQNDDTDVLDDGHQCTDDVCNAGTPANVASMSGMACTDDMGKMCDGNGACVECLGPADCASGICQQNKCLPASCLDGKENAPETDQDCGGPVCNPCADGLKCLVASDCKSGVCTGNVCQVPTCTDSVENGAETDKDCGGGTCVKCQTGQGCNFDTDCIGDSCSGTICLPSCTDTIKNATETDVDCGGSCSKCDDLLHCSVAADCKSGVCTGTVCQVPTCTDGVANGPETDKDCGGPCTAKCADLLQCKVPADCQSGVCTAGVCRVPTCADAVKNGMETDTDCGGALCISQGKRCATGLHCASGADCQTGVCVGTVCVAAACGDGVTNGSDQCDDGNTTSGDGCSSTCTVEVGFQCIGSPSACATTCGDGLRAGTEGCDDGNIVSGDGCSGTCIVELGFNCTGTAPTTCSAICGDGNKKGAEGCDDGNLANGDGCSSTCAVEAGFNCFGASPSLCSPICGDGHKNGTEGCDDGNVVSGDGCSATCTVEPGFGCTGASPTVCAAICGDGQKRGAEQCDDGNLASGDGCSATCILENGFTCVGFAPTVCTPICGDGQQLGSEQCDDGNIASGDGCSTGCNVEVGFTCTGFAPTSCSPICGDGLKRGTEECDDGNLSFGDGCSDFCTIEYGFDCAGSPSACKAICGDGEVYGDEYCDDGNTVSGDGCSFTCTIEPGWDCFGGGAGSCKAICGDGQKKGAEACDDANNDDFDGCTFDCQVEDGYTCTGTPSVCATTCGDGTVAGGEECDDGNTVTGDGCDATCYVEYGYVCDDSPTSICAPICGDGEVMPGEQCDDGNPMSDDGCSSGCMVEPGWVCEGSEFSYCYAICGDGIVVPGWEQCDDANTKYGDGCDGSCYVENTATCTGSPSVCTAPCGDGVRAANEQCDDGNTTAGDCCSPTCQAEAGCEVESNDYYDVANDYSALAMNNVVKGIVSQYDTDFYKFTVPAGVTGTLTATRLDGFLGTLCDEYYAIVGVYDADGNELDWSYGYCNTVTAPGLPPGDYYVGVYAYYWGETFDYVLDLSATYAICGDGNLDLGEQCDDGNTTNGDGCNSNCRYESVPESEPNDTCATASTAIVVPPAPDFALVSGTITPETDQDWFSFTLTSYSDLYVETFDKHGPGSCQYPDTVIQVFRPNCTALAPAADQGGINDCSLIDGQYDTRYQHLPPGTYKIKVTSHQANDEFDYTMLVGLVARCGDGVVEGSEACDGTPGCAADCTFTPVCGNGVKEAGEQCDDGNLTSGDGCSAACVWEKTPEAGVNDTPTDADAALPAFTGTKNVTGSISPMGDVDTYKVHVSTQQVVRFEIFDQSGYDCIAIPAMTLALLDSLGDEIRYDEASGIGTCPALVVNLAPGDYYIQAQRKTAGTIPSYFLQIKFETNNGNEVEPNDDQATANPDPGYDTFVTGAHQVGNADYFMVTIPPGPKRSIRAELIEANGTDSCESLAIDSNIAIFDSNGDELVSDEDGGRGWCSLIDGTGQSPLHPEAHNLAPGTYYLVVRDYYNSNFNYSLAVTIR